MRSQNKKLLSKASKIFGGDNKHLNTLHGTQDIPHMHHDFSHGTQYPHSTAHMLYRVLMSQGGGGSEWMDRRECAILPLQVVPKI